MSEYSEKLCNEKHKQLESRIDTHEFRLNNHSERLDKIEQRGAAVDAKIESLCDQIKSLVAIMKWYIGLTVGALVSFFFYAIEKGLFK
ncbi:hypothetical protein FDN13_01300 [Caloramator sp. E03]|uniref:hemolysin XhlA family protein n=1 Tax=Caloramator sp. E03 TaxID=2576307 RepID=UPI001110E1A3|nr:hemolysin XhlA family protein [Caloramator sp. E03]QCX32441.1 hypothetical protein FDN13_01300 [Caloramator sp. E03]